MRLMLLVVVVLMMMDGSRRRQTRLGHQCWRRSRGLEAGGHDGEVLGSRDGFARGLFLEELELGAGLDAPVVALAGIVLWSLDFDKVLVQTQVVSNAILPACVIGVVERIVVADPLVNLGKGEASF